VKLVFVANRVAGERIPSRGLSPKLLREQEGPNRARMRCSADLNQLAGAGTPGKQGFSNKYG